MSNYNPDEVAKLLQALDRSVRALAFAFPDPSSAEAKRIRELLSTYIIHVADSGEIDPVVLSNQALAWLPPYSASNQSGPSAF
jgi:hypothetical protein